MLVSTSVPILLLFSQSWFPGSSLLNAILPSFHMLKANNKSQCVLDIYYVQGIVLKVFQDYMHFHILYNRLARLDSQLFRRGHRAQRSGFTVYLILSGMDIRIPAEVCQVPSSLHSPYCLPISVTGCWVRGPCEPWLGGWGKQRMAIEKYSAYL